MARVLQLSFPVGLRICSSDLVTSSKTLDGFLSAVQDAVERWLAPTPQGPALYGLSIQPSSASRDEITRVCHHVWLFHVGFGDWMQTLMLTWQK